MEGEDGEIRERSELNPQEEEVQSWWDKANAMSLDEQIYLICSKTSNDEMWAMEQFTGDRLMWIVRILRDVEHEEKKYAHLMDTMVKLLSSHG